MPTVLLLSKIYGDYQLKVVEEFLKNKLKGLKISIVKVEASPHGWVQANISGEDEKAALNLLQADIGLCPTNIENIERFANVKGYAKSIGESKSEINVDIGITIPEPIPATIPLKYLQAQLADGRKMALQKIAELYGICENMPLTVKITSINKNQIEATLAEKQLRLYKKWIKTLLDRLIILGASTREVWKALKLAQCKKYTVEIEPLGLFEHAIACKLGTDGAGLIPKIGKNLPDRKLNVFSPRKLLEIFKDNPFFSHEF
ncbi:MAG: DUF2110 family protein [Candidatus Bathyarchaeia archaeon]